MDHGCYLDKPKSYMTTSIVPLYWIADIPKKINDFWYDRWISRTELASQVAQLKVQNLLLTQKLQKLSVIDTQNESLRALLNSSRNLDGTIEIAEVIAENTKAQVHQLILNKGSNNGVFIGQPLLDATGVMGQIINLNEITSTVLLLTDSRSRIPVEINRTGYRAIAAGNYNENYISLLNIPKNIDIKIGDLVVTSGLGGCFPSGYPVAEIFEKNNDVLDNFIQIKARPLAKLNQSRLVLLLYPTQVSH